MSQPSRFTPPPVPQGQELTQGSAVRRYHTISSTLGRNGRIAERRDSEEAALEEAENDAQWTGGSALASEKQASLQRNLSLPSKYHRREYSYKLCLLYLEIFCLFLLPRQFMLTLC
jgi:hypothetical protein